MKTITIRTASGVVFELRQARCGAGDAWVVIGSIGRQSVTAESMVSTEFMQGQPWQWWSRGYGQVIQRVLNTYTGEFAVTHMSDNLELTA